MYFYISKIIMNKFVDINFKKYIENVIRKTVLTNLNVSEFDQLMNLLYDLINFISIRFNFDLSNADQYIYQLKQNNNRDIYAIFNMLLPYIDDSDNFALHHEIFNLSDISIKKREQINGYIEKTNQTNKEIDRNPYMITNTQFNRNIRSVDLNGDTFSDTYMKDSDIYREINTFQNIPFKDADKYNYFEYKLTLSDIINNYYILLNTIDQVSNKLYINWLNIRPIKENYKESSLYKKSFKYDKELKNIVFEIDGIKNNFDWYNPIVSDDTYISKYQGISCGDIYNMIHHELYFGVKHYKWLIYEIPQNYSSKTQNKKILNYWDYIKDKFPRIDEYIGNDSEFELIEKESNNLIKEWTKNKNELASLINTDIVVRQIVYNILYYIQRKYTNKTELENTKFIELKIKGDTNDEKIIEMLDPDEEGVQIESDVRESWNSLDLKILYKYLMETINQFKQTWYGNQIITKQLAYPKFSEDCKINLEDKEDKITFKNIYNWAKSILLFTYGNYYEEKRKDKEGGSIVAMMENYREYNWHSLNSSNETQDLYNDRDNILNHKRLFISGMNLNNNNSDDKKNWFNISGILKKKYKKKNDRFISTINNNIFDCIKSNIIDICFECLWIRGLLNEFVPDKECTDNNLLGTTYESKLANRRSAAKKNIFNKKNVEEYKKCIYFLTSEPYEKCQLIREKNEKALNYFEYLEKQTGKGWMTFYAMDWISQINFFHRYINNRVIFVTGGTGAGKSSQVPKLLLYGLKMINFNNKGKVISTQPRVEPTKSNAINMAKDMGVPINEYSKELNDTVQTFNGYIQYKSKNDSYLNQKNEYFFREMTDGSLVTELYKNPILKKLKNKNEDNNSDKDVLYSTQNLYDIVIIDESHEHNKNMDIILTLMKYSTYWNNSIKLVIISATMTEDEPIYRRYYKTINDNLMFPLALYNANNYYYYDEYEISLDRNTVDRRIHISPPGESTQYVVLDMYLDEDIDDYEDAEIAGINKVKELIGKKVVGDILFFSVTENTIKNIVIELNNILPYNVIALPYYAKLPDRYKELGANTEKIDDFNINKLDIFDDIANKESRKVPKGTYNQVIVVATNAAEASITINNLRYVIDTGFYNSVVYDTINDETIQSLNKISEMSRIQRRGRVGRVAGGTVWYMYKKGARADIKSPLQICNARISDDIFKLMRSKNDENYFIHPIYDIYNIGYNYYVYNQNINNNFKYLIDVEKYDIDKKINDVKPENFNKENKNRDTDLWLNIYELLKYHFRFTLLNGSSYIFVYVGSPYLSENIELLNDSSYRIHYRYMTGYNMTSLMDLYGSFHIIHPSENLGIRHKMTGMYYDKEINEKYNTHIFTNINSLLFSNMITGIFFNTSLSIFNTNQLCYTKKIYKVMTKKENKIILLNTTIKDTTNDVFNKTEFADKLMNIMEQLEITDKDLGVQDETLIRICIGALIYGSILGIEKEICKTIAALLTLPDKMEMKTLIPKDGSNRFDLKKNPLSQFSNNFGDLITLFNIFDKMQKDLIFLYKIFEPLNEKEEKKIELRYDEDKQMYLKYKNKILTSKGENSPYDIILKDDYSKFKKISSLDQLNILDDKKGQIKYKKMNKDKLKVGDVSIAEYELIILWALNRNLDYNKIYKMINVYINLINKLKINSDKFDWFKKNVKINREPTLEENIIKCFLYGNPINISIYDTSDKQFHSLSKNNIYSIGNIYPSSKITDTTIIPIKYIFHLKSENDNIFILNNIKLKWVIEHLPHVYNKKLIDALSKDDAITNLFITDIINNS